MCSIGRTFEGSSKLAFTFLCFAPTTPLPPPSGNKRVSDNHLRAFHHLLLFLVISRVGIYFVLNNFLAINLTEIVML
ncbi:hypothetical protein PRUPE_7G018100 [Prunus persica]|uniref:Uncharacterized protein n=1 Tax=Prunus persica TaxID=3760 RepID=A0A251N568_PRUPE|nr:hypothetical protein PRUPE_7G018100 [Prunus persica]